MTLAGKTIIVSGAASGIGAAVAREVKSQGAIVIGVDRHEVSSNVDEFFRADLSVASDIDSLIERLPAGAHGLCNIAGLPPTAPAGLVLSVNWFGLKRLTLALIPRLADGASVVNLASLAGHGWTQSIDAIRGGVAFDMASDSLPEFCERYSIVGARSYFYSKEALIAWTHMNRWSWRDRGVRMNAVSPGPVQTPILKDFIETLGARAEEDMRLMDRAGRPEDVAPVVAFLLHDCSSWIRGTNIECDGGMSAHIQCARSGLE